MKTNIRYRVSRSPIDYDACQRLLRSVGKPKERLSFPTIMAWEGKELVGFCATQHGHKGALKAGPLILKKDRPRFMTALRLCEAYLTAMRSLGVMRFLIEVERDDPVHKAIHRIAPSLLPCFRDGPSLFYKWETQATPKDHWTVHEWPMGRRL